MIHHVWGLFTHPDQEWQEIRGEEESISHMYLTHILILAAIPAISAYIGTTQVGWVVGGGDPVKLTQASALQMTVLTYLAMLAGVAVMGAFIHWMARTYDANPSLTQCIVFAAYNATPLFIAGLAALYPHLWLGMIVGVAAISYTVYLLYVGIPTFMNIHKDEGFPVLQLGAGGGPGGAGGDDRPVGDPLGQRGRPGIHQLTSSERIVRPGRGQPPPGFSCPPPRLPDPAPRTSGRPDACARPPVSGIIARCWSLPECPNTSTPASRPAIGRPNTSSNAASPARPSASACAARKPGRPSRREPAALQSPAVPREPRALPGTDRGPRSRAPDRAPVVRPAHPPPRRGSGS